MTPERWHAIERVYHSARRLTGASQAAYLAEIGAHDPDLRQEVDSLLAHADAPSPLSAALSATLPDAATIRWPEAAALVGTRVGDYEIESWLDTGGMGVLFVARDAKLERKVALKVLPPSLLDDQERLLRFDREARALARLNHPNIAAIHGIVHADGVRAIVMELVEGHTLAHLIETAPDGRLGLDRALEIADQLAAALESAHEQGVVHRDLKPANIKVTTSGAVKVLDFGLARMSDPSRANDDLAGPTPPLVPDTRVGAVLGTSGYMSPEQARGLPIDKRTDIWAFGCVLHEMLTGSLPPLNTTRLDELPSHTPDGVRRLLARCLEPDPRHRLRDIGDARLDLADAAATGRDRSLHLDAGETHRSNLDMASTAAWSRGRAAWIAGLAAVLSGVAIWLMPRPTPAETPRMSRLALATAYPAVPVRTRNVAISPDGSRFTYATSDGFVLASTDGRADVHHRVEGGLPANIFFSPDSRFIGYTTGAAIYRMPLSGGSPVLLTATASGATATWGADGIVFTDPSGMYRVPADGGTPVRLPLDLPADEQAIYPELLPDGRTVLVTVVPIRTAVVRLDAVEAPSARIDAVNLQTGVRTTILRGAGAPRYTPTGHLLYLSERRLEAVAFDATRLTIRGEPIEIATTRGAFDFGASDDGTIVYFTGGGRPEFEPVWVDPGGQEEPLGAPTMPYVYPELSPDGSRVAFVAVNLTRGDRDVLVWDLERRVMMQPFDDPTDNATIAWSPDGRRLAFSSAREGVANAYWQNADGTGEAERIVRSPRIQLPMVIAPDGHILLSAEVPGEQRNILMAPLDGTGNTTTLVGGPAIELSGDLSPDGRWLAYDATNSGQFEVYVRPYPDAERGRWLVSKGGGRQPVWSRDGTTLFYRDFSGAVMSVAVTTQPAFRPAAPVQVLSGSGYGGSGSSGSAQTYGVARDGRLLMLKERTPAAPSLMLVTNWAGNLPSTPR